MTPAESITRLITSLFSCLFFLFLATPAMGNDNRFIKLDAAGQELPRDAQQWIMVKDTKTKLTWEVKTDDDSIHDKDSKFTWKQTQEEFIATLNKEKFGGFSDWRMPNETDIATIRIKKGEPPYTDTHFFPNTVPDKYWFFYICGDGTFMTNKQNFGKGKTRGNKYFARAVRGEEL